MRIAELRSASATFFDRHGMTCACALALCIPLKLLVVYILLIPLICFWLLARGTSVLREPLFVPFLLFVAATAISAFFGLNPARSFRGLLSLGFFSLSALFFTEIFRQPNGKLPLLFLLAGQGLAGITGTLQAAFPTVFERLFLGRIAESGQMSLTLILALALLLLLCTPTLCSPWNIRACPKSSLSVVLLAGGINTILLVAVGFSTSFSALSHSQVTLLAATGLIVICSLFAGMVLFKRGVVSHAIRLLLCCIILPGIVSGLLVNLKRGPWMGVAVASFLLLLRYEKRVVLPLVAAALLAIATIAPVRERLAQSSAHFFIHGGRSVLWEIGLELAPRYPLGVGYKNSRVLHDFSEQVPPELTHFHNNYINILVEAGWLALLCFLWWILRLLATGYHLTREAQVLGTGAGLAILSWQIAGIVEYNAGDSEVMLVVYLVVGLLAALRGQLPYAATTEQFLPKHPTS